MKLKLTLEYNGAAFSGWQYQSPEIHTIQGEIERALLVLLRSYSSNKELEFNFQLKGSGRTDRGVHAKAQVATFYWPDEIEINLSRFRLELNGVTSKELSIKNLELVDDTFCARFTPHFKRYCYTIHNANYPSILNQDYVWWITKTLNFNEMHEALGHIRGTHDFASFRAKDCGAKTSIRTLIKAELEQREQNTLVFTFEGNGFLKNMIRILVGTIAEVGKGSISIEEFKKILAANDRSLAGLTAPAHGLCMEFVKYERPISLSSQ